MLPILEPSGNGAQQIYYYYYYYYYYYWAFTEVYYNCSLSAATILLSSHDLNFAPLCYFSSLRRHVVLDLPPFLFLLFICLATCAMLPLLYSVHTFQFPASFRMCLGYISGLVGPGASCWIWLPCVLESLFWGMYGHNEYSLLLVSVIFSFFVGEDYQPSAQHPTSRNGRSLFVWFLPFDLFGRGGQHSFRGHWNTQASQPWQGVDPNRSGHLDISHNNCPSFKQIENDFNLHFQFTVINMFGISC